MHEDRLILALCEVDDAHQECKLLQLGSGLVGGVEDRPGEVHERMDQEGAEILDDEDGAPRDLRACGCLVSNDLDVKI